MMKKFNNLFEVNNQDTIGTALLKGATKGYIQGALAAGLGLGILAIGVFALSNDEESTEEEEKITDELDEVYEIDEARKEEIRLKKAESWINQG